MVAMLVWPTDGGDGVVATEVRWRKMAHLWSQSGVLDGSSTAFEVTIDPGPPGTLATVAPGAVFIMGHYAELNTSTSIDVATPGIMVVRFQASTNTAELIYRGGLLGPMVDAPDGDMWEVAIWKYTGGIGGTATDLRHFVNSQPDCRQFVLDNLINTTVAVGGTNSNLLIGSFTMPWYGDFTFYGTLKIANEVGGLIAVDPIEISTASTPAAVTRPPATWRVEAAPGAGQSIIHIPVIGEWKDVPRGTTCTLRARVTVGGAVDLIVARASGVATCVQNTLLY